MWRKQLNKALLLKISHHMISWWSSKSRAEQKSHLRASSGNFCVSTSGHEVCVSADVTTTDVNMITQSDPALLCRRVLTAGFCSSPVHMQNQSRTPDPTSCWWWWMIWASGTSVAMETTASGPSLIDSENKDLINIYSRARVVSEQCDTIVSLEHQLWRNFHSRDEQIFVMDF